MKSSHCGKARHGVGGARHRRWQLLLQLGGIAFAALMAGCGGGGSGGDGKSSSIPGRVVYAGNAEAAVKLSLEMIDVADVLTSSYGLGSAINSSVCESGSGTGTVTNCVIGSNTFSGAVSAAVTTSE